MCDLIGADWLTTTRPIANVSFANCEPRHISEMLSHGSCRRTPAEDNVNEKPCYSDDVRSDDPGGPRRHVTALPAKIDETLRSPVITVQGGEVSGR